MEPFYCVLSFLFVSSKTWRMWQKKSHINHTLRLKVKERWRCSYSLSNESFPYITVTANTEQDETRNNKMTPEFVPWIITVSFCIKQLFRHDSHHVICQRHWELKPFCDDGHLSRWQNPTYIAMWISICLPFYCFSRTFCRIIHCSNTD